MELTGDDRLMTSLPLFHVNAPAYSVLGSLACGAGLVLLPRFSASGFLDAARRHGATEFNAIGAMLEILMRQPERDDDADNPLRLCYTGPAPERERHLEIEERFGLRIVCGYAMSESPYGLIWPHGSRLYGTLGTVRQHPTLGVVNEGRVVDDDGAPTPVGEVGELMLRNPAVTPGYWHMPDETAAAITVRRLAAHRRSRHRRRRRRVHLRRAQEGGAAPPWREPVAGRGRGRARRASRRARVRRGRRAVRAVRRGDQGVRRDERAGRLRRAAKRGRASGCRSSRCRATGSSSTRCRARPRNASPSISCPPATPTTRSTSADRESVATPLFWYRVTRFS